MGLRDEDVKSLLQVVERSFYLAIRANVLEDKNQCDIFIEHDDLYTVKIFDFDNIKDVFDIGYANTTSILKGIALKK